jgi:hypothetical protein
MPVLSCQCEVLLIYGTTWEVLRILFIKIIPSFQGDLRMSANTKIVVLRRKELLYTGIFAALGVLFVILLLMLLLPGKAADTSGAPDSPDSTAETVMPDNVADLGRIPQSAQTEDVSTGAVADTDAVLDNASGPVGTDNTYIPGIYTTELILGSETVNVEVIVNDHAITSLSLADTAVCSNKLAGSVAAMKASVLASQLLAEAAMPLQSRKFLTDASPTATVAY